MRQHRLLGTITLLIGTIWTGPGTLIAQESCVGAPNAAPQERIVQRDIQEAIDQGIEEREAKGLDAISRQMPADYKIRLLGGTTLDRKQALEGIRMDLAEVLRMDADRAYTRIECLNLRGKIATVYTKQQYVRTVPDRRDSSPHEVITSVRHGETWVYTAEGWVVKHIEELEQGQTYLDGQPYDPR